MGQRTACGSLGLESRKGFTGLGEVSSQTRCAPVLEPLGKLHLSLLYFVGSGGRSCLSLWVLMSHHSRQELPWARGVISRALQQRRRAELRPFLWMQWGWNAWSGQENTGTYILVCYFAFMFYFSLLFCGKDLDMVGGRTHSLIHSFVQYLSTYSKAILYKCVIFFNLKAILLVWVGWWWRCLF